MPYHQAREHHDCTTCPHNTQPNPNNPAICSWTPDAVQAASPERREVIKLIERLQHNDRVPWCNHDRLFRIQIIRSTVIAVRRHILTRHEAEAESTPP